MTTKIATNLTTLLTAVLAQPEEAFNLDVFKSETPCGTLFCSVGLAASMPYFQELGFGFEARTMYDGETSFYVTLDKENIMDERERLDVVFGENAFNRLFKPAADGVWDTDIGVIEDGDYARLDTLTDKHIAVERLLKQIAIHEGVLA